MSEMEKKKTKKAAKKAAAPGDVVKRSVVPLGRTKKKEPENQQEFVVELPPVFGLRDRFTIEGLNEMRKRADSGLSRQICTWRLVALTGLQRAEDIIRRVRDERDSKIAGSAGNTESVSQGFSIHDHADFIRATSIASVMAACADEIEALLNPSTPPAHEC